MAVAVVVAVAMAAVVAMVVAVAVAVAVTVAVVVVVVTVVVGAFFAAGRGRRRSLRTPDEEARGACLRGAIMIVESGGVRWARGRGGEGRGEEECGE